MTSNIKIVLNLINFENINIYFLPKFFQKTVSLFNNNHTKYI